MKLKAGIAAGLVLICVLAGFALWEERHARKVVLYEGMGQFTSVAQTVQDKCMSCHTFDFDLPFYANIPGIKPIIEADYADGLRAMDLGDEFNDIMSDQVVSESTLAKMEWVTLNETMPPAKFAAIHRSSRMSAQDREEVLAWVRQTRRAHYATGLAVIGRSNEPIQPIPGSLPTDPQKVALGYTLFNDKRLSGDNTVSCHTCHELTKAGTDNARFSTGIREQLGDINSPTVFNAVFHMAQFWDGRSPDLAAQAGEPPMNPVEMGSQDWNQIIGKLALDTELTNQFTAVYADGWSGDNIMDAIGEYEKTLITPNSRFDKWLMGEDRAITAEELLGYERFKAYRCASCHVGVALGGQSYEYVDLKQDYFAARECEPLASDIGRGGVTQREIDNHRFKVPTLRNVELTWPYMHDGTVTTLYDAVHIMGIYLAGMDVTPQDNDLIVGFLRTLTGEYNGKRVEGVPVPR